MNKKIENLGLDSYKRTSPAQFPPIRVEYAVPEMIAQGRIPLSAPCGSIAVSKGKMEEILSGN
jgi:hypothetical protein